MTILGSVNAPALDSIAWYWDNSGIDFDLENGFDNLYRPRKRYQSESSATRPVKLKRANPWGLYDMLGNVWEWSQDHWHDNYQGAPADGSAWEDREAAAARVLRGGSCYDGAQRVRAACRSRSFPGLRLDYLGFRCARVQS